MKNLKSKFENEDMDEGKGSVFWDDREKRNRRFRNGKIARHINTDKRKGQVRITWD